MAILESRWGPAAEYFGAGLFLAYAILLFAHGEPPNMTDYANWTYQGVLLARHMQGLVDPVHVLKGYPVPNSAATVGVGLLTLVMPWMIAAKVWLCLQLLITFLALRQLARTTGACAAVWFIVPQAAFLGVNWWYGFLNFELGLAWVLLMASMLLRRARAEGGRDWVIGLVLVLAFFTHMIPFAFCGLLVVLYALQTRRWAMLWQVVPSALLTVWYVVGRYLFAGNADGQAGMDITVRTYSAVFWAYKVNSYLKSFGFVNPIDDHGSMALTLFGSALFAGIFAVSVLVCCLVGWGVAQAARGAYRERSVERFLWAGVLLLLPVYVLAPGTALGVSDPGFRVLQTVLALAMVLCCRAGSRVMKAAAYGSGILTMVAVMIFARAGFGGALHGSMDRQLPELMVEFAHVPVHDQDYYLRALKQGDLGLTVFPTGIFLNKAKTF